MTENGHEEFRSHSSSAVPHASPRTPPRHSYSATSLSEGGEDLEGNIPRDLHENDWDGEDEDERNGGKEDEDENNYSESFEEESVIENEKKMNQEEVMMNPRSHFKSPKIYESKIFLSCDSVTLLQVPLIGREI